MADYYHIKVEFEFITKVLWVHSEKTENILKFDLSKQTPYSVPAIIHKLIYARTTLKPIVKNSDSRLLTKKITMIGVTKNEIKELVEFEKVCKELK